MSKTENFEEKQPQTRTLRFNLVLSVKIDWELRQRLEQIALFEHMKPASLARNILVEKIHVYERNPAFKRFLKQLEEKKVRWPQPEG